MAPKFWTQETGVSERTRLEHERLFGVGMKRESQSSDLDILILRLKCLLDLKVERFVRPIKSWDWQKTTRERGWIHTQETKSWVPLALRGAGDEEELSDLLLTAKVVEEYILREFMFTLLPNSNPKKVGCLFPRNNKYCISIYLYIYVYICFCKKHRTLEMFREFVQKVNKVISTLETVKPL